MMDKETTTLEASADVAGRSEFALLSCPFCGGAAEFEYAEQDDGMGRVQCINSLCGVGIFDDRDSATEKWNQRQQRMMNIETAPRDGSMILILANDRFNGRIFEARWCEDVGSFTGRDGFAIFDNATKWLPWPETT